MDDAEDSRLGRFDRSRRRRRVALVALGGFGATAVLTSLLLQILLASPPPLASRSNQSFTFVRSTDFTPPECAVVSLSWQSTEGQPVSVAIGQSAEVVLVSDCRVSGAANFSCPALEPPPGTASMGPGPFYCQTGTRGTLVFTATQSPGYGIFEDQAGTNSSASAPILVHTSYANPLIPGTLELPVALTALVASGGAAASGVAVVATSLQMRRNRNPR